MPTNVWTAAIGTANSTVTNVTTSTTTTRNYQTVVGAESSLVSYYKLDETSGTTITDSKGGLNGTVGTALLNQPSLISNLGSSIKFSRNAAQQILIPAGATNPMNGLNSFSVELWYRRDAFDGVPQSEAIFDCLGTNNTGFKIYVQYYAPTSASRTWGTVAQFGTTGGYFFPTIFGGGGIPDASFFQANHVVVTYDGSNVNAYVNGRQTLSSFAFSGYSYAPVTSATSLKIGSYFQGAIDEVAIYNTALTADQVRNHYNAAGDFASTGDFPRRAIAPTRAINQEVPIRNEKYNSISSTRGSGGYWSTYAGNGSTIVATNSVADGPNTDLTTSGKRVVTTAPAYTSIFQVFTGGESQSGNTPLSVLRSRGYLQVTPGGKYSASAWFKGDTPQGTVFMQAFFRKANGDWLVAASSGSTSVTENQWIQLSNTFTVPPNAEWATFGIVWQSLTASQTYTSYYTGLINSTDATVPTFFDGNSTGARWVGLPEANGSYSLITNSTRSTPKIRSVTFSNAANATDELLNKLVNPSVEFGATITNASSDGTNYTYTANNAFSAGMSVTVLNVQPSGYQITGPVLSTGLSSTSFKIANTGSPGTFTQGGIAMANASYSPNLNSGTNTTVVTTPSTDAYAGSYSTNVAANVTSSTNQLVLNATTDISGSPFNGNRNIFVSAAIKLASVTNGTTMNFQIAARCYLNSNISSNIAPVSSIDILTTTKVINISDGWVIVSGVVKTAPGTERLGIRYYSSLNGAAAVSTYTYRIDQIAAVLLGDSPASTISSYFDGSYPNARWIGNQTINAYSGLSMVNMSGSYNRNISPSDPMKANDETGPFISQILSRQITPYDKSITDDETVKPATSQTFDRSPFREDTFIPNDETVKLAISQFLNRSSSDALYDLPYVSDYVFRSKGRNRYVNDSIGTSTDLTYVLMKFIKSMGYAFSDGDMIRYLLSENQLAVSEVEGYDTTFVIYSKANAKDNRR